MSAMQLWLPDDVRQFIEDQIKSGRYESPSAMIAALVEEARVRESRERLNALLEQGENSGPPIEFTEEWWEARKASLLARTQVASQELGDFLDEGEASEAIEYTDAKWQHEVASLKARVLDSADGAN